MFQRVLCTSQKFDDELKDWISSLVLSGRGQFVINVVRDFAENSLLAKSDVLLSTLAFCTTFKDGNLRQSVYSLVLKICRIPSDLFKYLTLEAGFSENKKGSFGRCKRRLVAKWYNTEVKSAKQLAVLMTKYRRRSGWSHVDVLRLAHVRPIDDVRGLLFKYALKGLAECRNSFNPDCMAEGLRDEARLILEYLEAVETVRHSHSEQDIAQLVSQHSLLQEHIPMWMKHSKLIWRALVEKMPLLATIKSLNNLTCVGLFDANDPNNCVSLVKGRLENADHLREAKIHPFTLLIAWKTYEGGHGERGSLHWKPNPDIISALKAAFTLSFKDILPTGLRFLLAIDCCESMSIGGVMDCPSITPLLASAAMAVAFSSKEPMSQIVLLSNKVQPVELPPELTLDALHSSLSKSCFGSMVADCSCPMTWAKDSLEDPVDVFVIYTCQTGQGKAKTPVEAIREYRDKMKHPAARLVVVTLTTAVRCLDPSNFDLGTMYLSGFDASVHERIRCFVTGQLDRSPGG